MKLDFPPAVPVQKRHTERVLLRIPIEIKGKNAEGKVFRETTSTLVINRDGARITIKQAVKANDRITITNLLSQVLCPFRVVGQSGQSMGEGPEWGVECLEENLDFWGIKFPEKLTAKGAAPAKKEMVDALIECSACHFRELAQLRMVQFRNLSEHSSMTRRCIQCDGPTEWRFGSAEGDSEKAAALHAPRGTTSPGEAHRRRAKRVMVKLPVRIRLVNGREEITHTENLSKTGVCFICSQTMAVGEAITLTVGYEPGKNESEIPARVVWRRPQKGSPQSAYGVHLDESA